MPWVTEAQRKDAPPAQPGTAQPSVFDAWSAARTLPSGSGKVGPP